MNTNSIGKILVVDDEVELKNILVEALTAQGYETSGFTNGEEALAALRVEAFDVLLTDLMMPSMDGITLVKESLEIDPHLIAIMMTGQGTIQTAVDAMKVGAFDYVLKPFRLQTVLPVLTRAMNTRHMRLENLQLRETVAIYELAQTIAFTLDQQTVISKLADAALQQTDADEVSVLLPTSDGSNELYVAAVRGENRERLLGERVPLDESISGWVAREREPLMLEGEVSDARFHSLWPHPEIRSAISIPMQVAGKLVGTININALSRPRPFTLGQLKALSILAGTAAAALKSASLYGQVRQAEENYRSIFENAVEGIFQSTPEGRFITVNPAMARILGYDSPAEMIAKITDVTHQLYVHPESRAEAARLERERGILQGFEFEAYRKDGEKIWLSLNRRFVRDENGTELYREGSVEDITERKRAEDERAQLAAEIETQRQRLDNIISSVPGVVWEAWGRPDEATQRIDFVSDYVETMLGYTVEEWLATPNFWLTIVHPDDKEEAARVAGARFASGQGGTQQFRWIARDGHVVWIESTFIVMKDDDGRPAGLRGVTTDISERKRAETERLLIFEIIQGVITTPNLDELFKLIHRSISKLVYAENCFVALHDETTNLIHFDYWVDKFDPVPPPHPLRKGFASYVLRTNQPLLLTEELKSRMYGSGEVEKSGRSSASWLGVPLRTPSQAIGVLVIQHYENANVYTERDLEFLSSVGDQIALAIERKRAEEALRESEERYRDLVENSHEIICTHDLDGKILSVNRATLQILGYEPSDFVNKKNIQDILAPEVRDQFDDYMKEILEKRATSNLMLVQTRSGERRVLEYYNSLRTEGVATPIVRAIARDITERKRAEEALRESEERYRDLVENAHDIIFSHDLKGNYTSVNRAGEQITGYTHQECLTLNIADTIAPEHVGKAREMLAKKLAGEKVTAYEVELLAKDGKRIAVEVNTKLILQDSVPVGVQGIARDVTVRKQLEDQLRQSQKMEAIGKLAGGVAHDFNNLLTAINGYSSLALQRIEDTDPIKSYLEEIKKAGDRAANLTRQLLAFGRKQILQPLAVNLNDIVTDMNKMLRRLIGEDIELTAKLDPALKKIKADPGQIEQVLVNLVVNARDAMPQGGNLTIETASVELDPEYASTHVSIHTGPYVVLAVSDTGTGMDEEVRRHIFEPFFTTKEKGKGTGLGLSTVHGIVNQSGGSIWVYSEPNRGTTFKVYLPALDSVPKSSEARAAEASIPKGSETVLLVEDEEVVRGLARRILEEAGYRVLVAQQGEEAIRLCIEDAKEIHLLLTDVVMPGAGGKEVANRLSSLRPGIKVLFMSGYTDEAIVHHGVLDSDVKFIQKPFSPAALARKVREVLDSNGKVSTG